MILQVAPDSRQMYQNIHNEIVKMSSGPEPGDLEQNRRQDSSCSQNYFLSAINVVSWGGGVRCDLDTKNSSLEQYPIIWMDNGTMKGSDEHTRFETGQLYVNPSDNYFARLSPRPLRQVLGRLLRSGHA